MATKTIHKAYKFRLKTDEAHAEQLARIAGVCRLVWNLCLEQRTLVYSSSRKFMNSYNQLPEVTQLRKEYDWIEDVPSQVLQQKVRDLDTAYRNFFEGCTEFPKRKKKGRSSDSFRFPQGFKVDNRRIFLPKIGWIEFFKSGEIKGTIRYITVSRYEMHWYVSVACEVDMPNEASKAASVGIDMGVKKLCAMSDGSIVENPDCLKQHEKQSAKLQHRLARKQKYSKHFFKQKSKITAIHTIIADTRRDHAHKTTTTIAKNHDLVAFEDLLVKAMSKSAKGTIDKPGRKVRQKSGLNRVILDAEWREFRRQLEYKEGWMNGIVIAVDPKNTSRMYSVCGHTAKENRWTQADFIYTACGHTDDADVNAAINILRAGHARLACQANGDLRAPATGTIQLAA